MALLKALIESPQVETIIAVGRLEINKLDFKIAEDINGGKIMKNAVLGYIQDNGYGM